MADSLCEGCRKFDSDPKAHWNTGGSFHHDCLPAQLRQELIDNHPLGLQIIEAAEGGKRGKDLLAFIQQLHENLPKEEE